VPGRLQQLADPLSRIGPIDLRPQAPGSLEPFFTVKEREQAGSQHRLSQVDFCDNFIFRRRTALDDR